MEADEKKSKPQTKNECSKQENNKFICRKRAVGSKIKPEIKNAWRQMQEKAKKRQRLVTKMISKQ